MNGCIVQEGKTVACSNGRRSLRIKKAGFSKTIDFYYEIYYEKF